MKSVGFRGKSLACCMVLLLCVAVLLGCSPQKVSGGGGSATAKVENLVVKDASVLESRNMDYKLADSSKITVHKYNLGEGKLTNSVGKKVPCPLNGLIAVPDGQTRSKGAAPYPVVVLIHGVKTVKDVYHDDNYEGFEYLARQLAAQGYVALSMNVSVNFTDNFGESPAYDWALAVYRQQMKLLEAAASGKEVGFPVKLAGLVDLSQLHLIGHSRGGQIIDYFARAEVDEGLDRIKSLLMLAPGKTYLLEGNLPDVALAVVVGEQDEDIADGDGQFWFDEAMIDTQRSAPTAVVFLRGASHAYFNQKFALDKKDGLTREQQEHFTLCYVSSFLEALRSGWKQPEAAGIFDVAVAEPTQMFGCAVTASFLPGGGADTHPTVVVADKAKTGVAVGEGAALDYVDQLDETTFHHPNGNGYAPPLYRLDWKQRGASVSFDCGGEAAAADKGVDFSAARALSLYVALNPASDLNANVDGSDGARGQAVTVALTDGAGKTAAVIVPEGTAALQRYIGELTHQEASEFEEARDFWKGLTPLGEVRIPLSSVSGIDLTHIVKLTLVFDQSPSGSIMFSRALLEK